MEYLIEVTRPVVERISVKLHAPANADPKTLQALALEIVRDEEAQEDGEWESFSRDVMDGYQVSCIYDRRGVRHV